MTFSTIKFNDKSGAQRALAAQQAELNTPCPALPPGLDASIFDDDQLEYLADYYQSEILRHLRLFYILLRAVPPGAEPTVRTVGINAAILARLFALEEPLAEIPWGTMYKLAAVRKSDFLEQFRAVRSTLRALHPRAALAYDRHVADHRQNN
jgi:hypothetical protein